MSKQAENPWEELLREREVLLAEMASLGGLIRASLFERFTTCTRPQCHCHKPRGKRHGPRTYLAVTRAKHQCQHYVPVKQTNAAKQGLRQYHRLLEIVDRITEINLTLMREGKLDDLESGKPP